MNSGMFLISNAPGYNVVRFVQDCIRKNDQTMTDRKLIQFIFQGILVLLKKQ